MKCVTIANADTDKLVEVQNKQVVTTSRKVAEVFEKRHDHVIRDIEAIKKDAPNFGEMFREGEAPDSYGRPQKVFFLNRDGLSLLAMGFTGKKAMQWKVKYIEAFNQMEKLMKEQQKPALPDFTDPVIAARAWADEVEKKQIAEAKVAELQPKADFYDAAASSESLFSMADVAKVLDMGIGRNKLFKFLREKKILQGDNMPYQRFVDAGYFKVVEGKFMAGDNVVISKTTYVKQKGIDYIRKCLTNETVD